MFVASEADDEWLLAVPLLVCSYDCCPLYHTQKVVDFLCIALDFPRKLQYLLMPYGTSDYKHLNRILAKESESHIIEFNPIIYLCRMEPVITNT